MSHEPEDYDTFYHSLHPNENKNGKRYGSNI